MDALKQKRTFILALISLGGSIYLGYDAIQQGISPLLVLAVGAIVNTPSLIWIGGKGLRAFFEAIQAWAPGGRGS